MLFIETVVSVIFGGCGYWAYSALLLAFSGPSHLGLPLCCRPNKIPDDNRVFPAREQQPEVKVLRMRMGHKGSTMVLGRDDDEPYRLPV